MAVFFIFNLLILLINLVILPIYDVIDMWNPRLSTIGATVKVGQSIKKADMACPFFI